MSDELSVEDRITKAKIRLGKDKPFFAYLVLQLNCKEFTEEQVKQLEKELGFCSMGVDINSNMYYNPKFVKTLSHEQLQFAITHEVLHLALFTFAREGKRNKEIFNIASDLCINGILKANGFVPLPKLFIPKDDDTFMIGKKEIKDISKKSAEEIYDEIVDDLTKDNKLLKDLLEGRFDIHIEVEGENGKDNKDSKDEKGSGLKIKVSKEQLKEIEDKWKKAIVEATIYEKNTRGTIPAGMERQVDGLLNEKVNWKSLLYRYITNNLICDFSWSSPSKRSLGCGIYLPSSKKEELEVVVVVDTSGSIDGEMLKEFLSEIVGLGKSFVNIKIRVISCDCEVQNDYLVENGEISKILNLRMKGGGGTSYQVPLGYIKENYPQTKLVIFLTDGYGDLVNGKDYPFHLIWVLSKNGSEDCIKDSGEIINL